MPVYKNNQEIRPVYKGVQEIGSIYKGEDLVYQSSTIAPSYFSATLRKGPVPSGQIDTPTLSVYVTLPPYGSADIQWRVNISEKIINTSPNTSEEVLTYTYGTGQMDHAVVVSGPFSSIRFITGNTTYFAELGTISGQLVNRIQSFLFNTTSSATGSAPTSIISSIPQDYFRNCPNIDIFDRAFQNNTALRGSTPTNENGLKLWQLEGQPGYPGMISGNLCFAGCVNLDDYDEIPVGWK